jgi:lipopolysaccharide export system permease protein
LAAVTLRRFFPYARRRSLLSILDLYLLREMFWPFVAAFFGYFIFWALNIFVLSAQYILNQHEPFFLVLRFVLLRVPQSIPMAFPFASLLASMLAMGRLMGDNEVNAMRASGIHVLRIAATPLLFGVAMFLVTYLMNEYVAPQSVDLSTRTFYQMLYHSDTLPFDTQFFRKDPDSGNTFYVNEVGPDGKTLYGVQIFKPGPSGMWLESLQAKSATIDGSILTMHNVVETRFNNDGFEVGQQRVKSATIGLPLQESAEQFLSTANTDPWTMNSRQLARQVHSLEAQGIGGTDLYNKEFTLANKLAWPFACVIAVLVALPLAIRFGKRGWVLSIALSFVSFFLYFVIMSVMSALGSSGKVNPYVAAWIPNIVMGLAGASLLWLEER